MSGPVTECQSCASRDLELALSLGHLPNVNAFRRIGHANLAETFYPHDLLRCVTCELVQLGFVAPQEEVFPTSYPYTSSTTRALRENFADLYREVMSTIELAPNDLVIDIGGNDGNLLSNFTGHRTLNVTPEDIGKLGEARGIAHMQRYWGCGPASEVVAMHGKARVVTATNVFAHVPDPHGFVEAVLRVLEDDGLFVLECHYLGALLQTVQYDTIYAEHQRYYSLASLSRLLDAHGLTVFHAHTIPTHGGSFRAFATRKPGAVGSLFEEPDACSPREVRQFARRTARSKRALWNLIGDMTPLLDVVGIGAPSRAATLINYTGLDHNIIRYICETPGSHKLGHCMPGTRIPVVDEDALYREQPEYAMLFSWHIADELMNTLRSKGYRGRFIIPLPEPRIVE